MLLQHNSMYRALVQWSEFASSWGVRLYTNEYGDCYNLIQVKWLCKINSNSEVGCMTFITRQVILYWSNEILLLVIKIMQSKNLVNKKYTGENKIFLKRILFPILLSTGYRKAIFFEDLKGGT